MKFWIWIPTATSACLTRMSAIASSFVRMASSASFIVRSASPTSAPRRFASPILTLTPRTRASHLCGRCCRPLPPIGDADPFGRDQLVLQDLHLVHRLPEHGPALRVEDPLLEVPLDPVDLLEVVRDGRLRGVGPELVEFLRRDTELPPLLDEGSA